MQHSNYSQHLLGRTPGPTAELILRTNQPASASLPAQCWAQSTLEHCWHFEGNSVQPIAFAQNGSNRVVRIQVLGNWLQTLLYL